MASYGCVNKQYGNASYGSNIQLCLTKLEETASGDVTLTFTMENQPLASANGAFYPSLDVVLSVDGTDTVLTNSAWQPVGFPGTKRTFTHTVSSPGTGSHKFCLDLQKHS